MRRLLVVVLGSPLAACSLLAAPEANPGAGGGGGSQTCNVAEDCPATESACVARVCDDGVCEEVALPSGTLLGMQTNGDCAVATCDGAGTATTTVDDTDVPDDAAECTDDVCTDGVPSNPPKAAGSACGDDLVCDGAGQCTGCGTPDACPGRDDDCQSRTCERGVCGLAYAAAGTPTIAQTAGDCRETQCDGSGGTTSAVLDTDTPNDNNDCTIDGCSSGTPTSTDVVTGGTCDDAGIVCDGMGSCVACNLPADCGVTTACRTYSCAAHTCSFVNAASGTTCAFDGGSKCDGNGACVQCVVGGDCPSGVCQGNACVASTCMDLAQNGDETDTDCGGSCGPCALGDTCLVAGDCQTGNCQTTCQPVVVVTTSPESGAQNATVGGPISITFSGAMTPASLTAKTTLDSGPCSGSVRVSTDDFVTCVPMSSSAPSMSAGNTVAAFTPAPGLAFGSTFKIRVTSAATDAQGAPIGAAFTTPAGFTTRYGVLGTDVVISQVYGGGGNAGAPLSHDFVELHNRSAGAVSVAGWSLQYASPGGTTWSVTALSGSIAPGGYYLVRLASGGASGTPLPAPDATGLTNMSATAGKVALVASDVALSGTCPQAASIADLVGYGGASCFEGSGPAATLSVTTAAWRAGTSCGDTDDNAVDLTVLAPAPRNASTAPAACTVLVPNESGLAYEADSCVVSPTSLSVVTGASSGPVTLLVTEAGLTEAPGQGAGLVAQIGFGPRSANPQHQAGFVWSNAVFDQQVGSADQMTGSFTAPSPGIYSFAYRVSVDGGLTWTYCDGDGAGSDVGKSFETTRIPLLTVTN